MLKRRTFSSMQVVEIAAPKIVQGLGGLALRFSHDVFPTRAVTRRQLGRDGLIGIDCVSRVKEEVGLTARIVS